MRGHFTTFGRSAGLAALIALTITNRHALAGPGQGYGGRTMHRAIASLDLTDEQKTKVNALAEQQKGDVQSFRQQMKADHVALRAAIDVASPDPTAVGNAFLKVRSDRQAVKARLQEFRSKLMPILTKEQNARLDGFLAAMRPMRGGMSGDPGRHHQGFEGQSGSFR